MSYFGPLFGMMFNGDDDDDDEPVVLNVETDGDEQGSQSAYVSHEGDSTGSAHTHSPRRARARIHSRANYKPRGKRPMPLWGKILLGVLIACIVLAAIFVLGAQFITDIMWFTQLGFQSIIWTKLAVQIGAWVLYVLLVAAVGFGAASLAIARRPSSADGTQVKINGNVVEFGKTITSRQARLLALVIAAFVGIGFGSQFNANWKDIVLMLHAQQFGQRDPQFGIDLGFYVFVLPGLQLVLASLQVLLAVGLVFSFAAHILVGAIRFDQWKHPTKGLQITKFARRQVSLWLTLSLLLASVRIILGMFDTLTMQSDRFTGADFTTVTSRIPWIIALGVCVALIGLTLGAWLIFARLPFTVEGVASVKATSRGWSRLAKALAGLTAVVLVLSIVTPAITQRFRVDPNAQEVQSPFIERNIAATRMAFGLDKLKTSSYDVTTQGQQGALAQDAESTAQIRLLDPQIISPTFKQLQQSKQYYMFADTLAVDKYDINGQSQDTVIAAREINLSGLDNRNWVNDHTVYTHGYGVVAAYGNKVSPDGQPQFFEYGIPTQGALTESQKYEPRIYFSPNATEYSIVGAPEGRKGWEFDYPTGSQSATTTFTGDGGPSVGSLWSRLLYAIRFGSDQILFSDRVTSASQILYNRSPKERVAQVAPYLTLDGRVYPAVVDGRVKWIVDGFTTSANVPYSQMVDLEDATEDSTTERSKSVTELSKQQVNYMRNSVKATVDAYDGSVDLYVWDESDPIIRAWQSVFPSHYHPLSEISGDLMSHLRYPESLFKVQRQLLTKYHVTNAHQFFSGEDFWQTPKDPTVAASNGQAPLQPPYYITLQTGGSKKPVFSLTSTYIPAGSSTREILTGFLSVDSDAGNTAGKIGENYGTIRLQELPSSANVPGPGQAQNNFNASAEVSRELNLLEAGSTNVVRGNLLTLPLGGGLVYVEPVYVRSSGATSYPMLQKVLVAFGDQVGFADTLDEALDQVFGGNSGASAGDADNVGQTERGETGESSEATEPNRSDSTQSDSAQSNSQNSTGTSDIRSALEDAAQAMKDSDTALKQGDWTAYGKAQQELQEALEKAMVSEGIESK